MSIRAGFTLDGCYRYPSGALTSEEKVMQDRADGERGDDGLSG